MGVLLGDIVTAPRFGLMYIEFADYLFSLWSFTGLVLSQLGIASSVIMCLYRGRRGSKTRG
jgi:hypothetical protein